MPVAVYICVQGLFERSDSIGFDAVWHYRLLRGHFAGVVEARLFCERAEQTLYPDVEIEPIGELAAALAATPEALVLYHFCDGWAALEQQLIEHRGRVIVRWHNNTPPWFFAKYALRFVERTVRGFAAIVRLAQHGGCRFWCNSNFTADQLEVLGVGRDRIDVVYPASRYLDGAAASGDAAAIRQDAAACLLFVGRIVPHKGHKQMLLTAAYLEHRLGLRARVVLPGRIDPGMPQYTDDLRALADRLAVRIEFPGEVEAAQLDRLYREADAFLCLSEHEGFGMPIFEAMRMGVPTLAWANTATAELLSGHPLAHRELSPRWFAAATAALLQDPDIRQYVLRWQDGIALPRYTGAVVAEQLAAALSRLDVGGGGATASAPDAGPGDLPDPRMQAHIEARVGHYLGEIGPEPVPAEAAIPREIPGNFVSLYDIEAYEALTRAGFAPAALVAPGNRQQPDGEAREAGILVPAARFSSTCGRLVEGSYVCPLSAQIGHAIFGPYCAVPAGAYRVEFRVEVFDLAEREEEGEFVFDVTAGEGDPLCQRVVSLRELRRAESIALDFLQAEPQALTEFRIYARRFRSGSMRFAGAVLAPIACRDTMAGSSRWNPARWLTPVLGRRARPAAPRR